MGRMAAVGLAVAAAAIGAGVALLVGSVAGVGGSTTTIVETNAAPAPSTHHLASAAPARHGIRPGGDLRRAGRPVSSRIYANLGIDGTAQGSGFVVDRDGVILTNAHVITNVAEARTNVQGARDGVRRVRRRREDRRATIVGWDLFSDVGVIRVEARRPRASSPCRSGTRRRSSSASRSPRSEARSASRAR